MQPDVTALLAWWGPSEWAAAWDLLEAPAKGLLTGIMIAFAAYIGRRGALRRHVCRCPKNCYDSQEEQG